MVGIEDLIPKVPKGIPIFASAERIFQPITDFIRGNPLVSTAAVGIGTTGLVTGIAAIRKPRKKKRAAKRKPKRRAARRKAPRRRKKKTKAQIKAERLRNLAKARRARRRPGKRRVIKGPGLGTHEIKHSGKSTKGKFKLVSFRDKRTGKMVRFKARR